jgi:pimeloyl-ACP methyl ester carboxylesterase
VIGHPNLSAPSRPDYASDAYARWLDDVLGALGVARASFVGMSLGGWLALDYAARRPERVSSLVLLCPGGIGREKLGTLKLLFVILPLLALGDAGRRWAMRLLLGPVPSDASPEAEAVGELMRLVFTHFEQNLAKLARFEDEALRRVTAPVLLIVGARDAMLDSAETRRRLESTVPRLEVRWLPESGHTIVGQTVPIADFLRRAHQGGRGGGSGAVGRATVP